MNANPQLKHPHGFFAAGPEMLRALYTLSDGAFRLFVYCALKASRRTGRLEIRYRELAQAIGKSRRSIITYLEELAAQGVCRIHSASNQHQPGVLEIEEAFWPYHRQQPSPQSAPEAGYVEQVKRWFLAHPIVGSSFGAADRLLAGDLYRQGIPLEEVKRALLLGLARKYVSWLNLKNGSPISSLHYFLPLLEELKNTQVSDSYWSYLEQRLKHYQKQWLEQPPAPQTSVQTPRLQNQQP